MKRVDPRKKNSKYNAETLQRYGIQEKQETWPPHFINNGNINVDTFDSRSIVLKLNDDRYIDHTAFSVVVSIDHNVSAKLESNISKLLIFLAYSKNTEIHGVYFATSINVDTDEGNADIRLFRIVFLQPTKITSTEFEEYHSKILEPEITREIVAKLYGSTRNYANAAAEDLLNSSNHILAPEIDPNLSFSEQEICDSDFHKINENYSSKFSRSRVTEHLSKKLILFIGGPLMFQIFQGFTEMMGCSDVEMRAKNLHPSFEGEIIEWHGNNGGKLIYLQTTFLKFERKRKIMKHVFDEHCYDFVLVDFCPLTLLGNIFERGLSSDILKYYIKDLQDLSYKEIFAKGLLIWIPSLPVALLPSDEKIKNISTKHNNKLMDVESCLKLVEKQLPLLESLAHMICANRCRTSLLSTKLWFDGFLNINFRLNNGYTWAHQMVQWLIDQIFEVISKVPIPESSHAVSGKEFFVYIDSVNIRDEVSNSTLLSLPSADEQSTCNEINQYTDAGSSNSVRSILKKTGVLSPNDKFDESITQKNTAENSANRVKVESTACNDRDALKLQKKLFVQEGNSQDFISNRKVTKVMMISEADSARLQKQRMVEETRSNHQKQVKMETVKSEELPNIPARTLPHRQRAPHMKSSVMAKNGCTKEEKNIPSKNHITHAVQSKVSEATDIQRTRYVSGYDGQGKNISYSIPKKSRQQNSTQMNMLHSPPKVDLALKNNLSWYDVQGNHENALGSRSSKSGSSSIRPCNNRNEKYMEVKSCTQHDRTVLSDNISAKKNNLKEKISNQPEKSFISERERNVDSSHSGSARRGRPPLDKFSRGRKSNSKQTKKVLKSRNSMRIDSSSFDSSDSDTNAGKKSRIRNNLRTCKEHYELREKKEIKYSYTYDDDEGSSYSSLDESNSQPLVKKFRSPIHPKGRIGRPSKQIIRAINEETQFTGPFVQDQPQNHEILIPELPWLKIGSKIELECKSKWYHAKVEEIYKDKLVAAYLKYKGQTANVSLPFEINGISEPKVHLTWTDKQLNS